MATAHFIPTNGHHESLDSFQNAGSSGYDLDHIPVDDHLGEAALNSDSTHAGVPLHNEGHQPHNIGIAPDLLRQPSLKSDELTNTFMDELEWDRMMNEICAAPVLPSLESNDNRKGSTASIQKFYEGRATCKCCINWVEKQPERVPDEAKDKYNGVAIRIYHGKDHSKETLGGLKTVSPLWLVIQSPVILEALEPIFKKIGRAGTAKGSVQVDAPFVDLFFAYSGILEAYSKCEQDSEEEQHLGVLKEVTDELLREMTSEVTDLQAKKLITYQYLWTLFPKGIVVVSKQGNHECLLEVISYDTTTTTVMCRSIAFDGSNYGFLARSFTEIAFSGARAICELSVYPLSFHKNREEVEKNTVLRSRNVLRYQRMVHAEHSQREEREDVEPTSMRERIIVDPYAYHNYSGLIRSLTRLTSENTEFDKELRNHFECQGSKDRPSTDRIQKNVEIVSSKPHWLLMLEPFIAGYSLKAYEFTTFHVDYIREVRWNDWAYERIVFSEDSKDLLLTLAKNHKQVRDIGSDIIPGKGNGFVVLLSGPPGTGKTLTAEAIADQAKRPFFRIQAETLGRSDMDLEEELEECFKLATEWNAFLLIDEADAYLGSDCKSTDRSSLVRTLMTRLEYYSGVLFLTTNFPEKIDEAFSSRIDVHFEYPALDRTSRCKLLKTMVEFTTNSNAFVQPADLSEQDYWHLARWELNGRELKNAVKVSSRLCLIKKEKLTYRVLEMGILHTAPRKIGELELSPPLGKRPRLS